MFFLTVATNLRSLAWVHVASAAPTEVEEVNKADEQKGGQGTDTSIDKQSPSRASEKRSDPIHGVSIKAQPFASTMQNQSSVRGRSALSAAPHLSGSHALLTLPGVWISQHSGEGKAHQIFLRGYDAVHGQDIEFWVGGAPVNDVSNIHGQGYADLHFVSPELISKLELLPGAYLSSQGDFAVAGSIHYELGLDQPGSQIEIKIGSFGSQRLFAGFRPQKGDPNNLFGLELYRTNGFGPARSAARASAAAQWTFELGDSLKLRFLSMVYHARFDSSGVRLRRSVEQDIVEGRTPFLLEEGRDSHQGGVSTRIQFVAELFSHTQNEHLSFAPFFVVRDFGLRANYTGYIQDKNEGDQVQQLNAAKSVGFSASYRKKIKIFSEYDEFLLGFYARYDSINQSQNRLSDIFQEVTKKEVLAEIKTANVASYIDLNLHPVESLSFRFGLRADGIAYGVDDLIQNFATRNSVGFHLGPKLSATYAFSNLVHVALSYGRGFRSPEARSLVDGQKTPFTQTDSYQLSANYRQATPHLALLGSLVFFQSFLSDDLVFDPNTGRNESVPASKRTGLSLDLSLRSKQLLYTGLSVTYTRAEFRESNAFYQQGDLLPYVPQVVARFDASFTPQLGRLSLIRRKLSAHVGVGLSLLARRALPLSEFGKDVFLSDAKLALRAEEFELGLDIHNLLNATYFDSEFMYPANFKKGETPSLLPQRVVTVGPPRMFMMSFGIRF